MKWFLMLVGLFAIVFMIRQVWRYDSTDQNLRQFFFPALIFKVLAGWAAGLVYQYYYNGNGDIFLFFNTSWDLVSTLINDPFSPKTAILSNQGLAQVLSSLNSRTIFFLGFLSIPVLFSGGVYWICSLYVSVISFLVTWYFVRTLVFNYYRPEILYASVGAFLFYPSVAFWSGGLFKESLSTIAIFLLLASVISMAHAPGRQKIIYMVISLISVIILAGVKYYLAALAVPVLVLYLLIFKYNQAKGKVIQLASIMGVVLIFFIALSFFSPNLNLSILPEVVNREYLRKVIEAQSERYVYYPNLNASWAGLIVSAPKALFVGLFSPLTFNTNNPFLFIASVENFVVLFVVFLAIWKMVKQGSLNLSREVLFLLLYVIIASILLALTTPNIGTLSRYKIAYMPFFFFVSLMVLFAPKKIASTNEK
ncbi:MAG: hypothetical protein R8N23_20450 [Reichenbachiella sp.]|uniref:hypothetical protein n=1 Tax=Reichenbachiella sp. TaxID=2184521 RepID=UPI0029667E9E|nr:hypothetical protein [Reichenbachiella sp.]MDW3212253.1 hypothetical protein [Reichenbachiella sp.]